MKLKFLSAEGRRRTPSITSRSFSLATEPSRLNVRPLITFRIKKRKKEEEEEEKEEE